MTKKISFIFLLLSFWPYTSYASVNKEVKYKHNEFAQRKKTNILYNKMYAPYVPHTKKEGLLINDIKKAIPFTKEINLDEEYNNKMFKKGYPEFINQIFTGIKQKKIKAYKNGDLTTEMSIDDIQNNLLKPKDVGLISTKNITNKYFSHEDIKTIEIDGFCVETIKYPRQIFDNLVIKLIIPAKTFDNIMQHIVCFLQYDQCMKYISEEGEIKILKKGKEIECKKAFDDDFFKFRYIFVDNIDIKNKDYEENHLEAETIFSSKE